MRHGLFAIAVSMAGLLGLAHSAAAQELTPSEFQGRNLVNQNCAICHLKPQFGAKTFGPALNRETLAGNAQAIRDFISLGTERMPGFRYRFTVAQIDSIAAYMKTVPATPPNTSQR